MYRKRIATRRDADTDADFLYCGNGATFGFCDGNSNSRGHGEPIESANREPDEFTDIRLDGSTADFHANHSVYDGNSDNCADQSAHQYTHRVADADADEFADQSPDKSTDQPADESAGWPSAGCRGLLSSGRVAERGTVVCDENALRGRRLSTSCGTCGDDVKPARLIEL